MSFGLEIFNSLGQVNYALDEKHVYWTTLNILVPGREVAWNANTTSTHPLPSLPAGASPNIRVLFGGCTATLSGNSVTITQDIKERFYVGTFYTDTCNIQIGYSL